MPTDVLVVLALAAFAIAVVASVASGIRRVSPDERLVLVRAGRFDQNSLRGPGLVFLRPITDRGVRVSLLPQHFALDAVPATASDGSGVFADLDVSFRVVDPVAFVTSIPPPPAGLRAIARAALKESLRTAVPGEALFPGDVESQIAPLLEGRLASAGAHDVAIRVTRVRPGSVEGADEAEFQALLRQEGLPPGKPNRSRDIHRR